MNYELLIFLALILEALPISSSGHMALLEGRMGALPGAVDQLLHGPFALAIVLCFLPSWLPIFRNIFSYKRVLRKLFWLIFVIDGVTFIGFLFKNQLPHITLWAGFAITSLAMLSLLLLQSIRPPYQALTFRGAAVLGVVQALTLLPGISRFGCTYAASRWLGLRPDRAIQLSFLAHLPLTLGGLLLGIYKGGLALLPLGASVAIALGVLGATALLYLMQQLALRRRLWVFGLYLLLLRVLAFWQGWWLP